MQTNEFKQGVLYALCAYTLWGFAPLYFKLIQQIAPLEIIMHRIVWSCVLLFLLVLLTGQVKVVIEVLRQPKKMLWLALTSLLIGVNWLVFIWAVNNDRMLEASLGYFINPLFNVALGMLFFNERLPKFQLFAVALAGFGVVLQLIVYGSIPWVSLSLASSFGIYGLIKKKIQLKAIPSLFIETAILVPFALIYWWMLESSTANFSLNDLSLNLIIISSGIVTTLPLLAFSAAATRIPYYMLGLFQYIGPSLMFIMAILMFGEELDQSKLTTFGFIWVALLIFVFDIWRNVRRKKRLARE
ncbi:MAG: EamA family transporter RarD [Oceanospirillaceae bacterium]|nr:EamA family transporter RarD [Oceanospirillaceae bacterium]